MNNRQWKGIGYRGFGLLLYLYLTRLHLQDGILPLSLVFLIASCWWTEFNNFAAALKSVIKATTNIPEIFLSLCSGSEIFISAHWFSHQKLTKDRKATAAEPQNDRVLPTVFIRLFLSSTVYIYIYIYIIHILYIYIYNYINICSSLGAN